VDILVVGGASSPSSAYRYGSCWRSIGPSSESVLAMPETVEPLRGFTELTGDGSGRVHRPAVWYDYGWQREEFALCTGLTLALFPQ
jgi:hypothetical protein